MKTRSLMIVALLTLMVSAGAQSPAQAATLTPKKIITVEDFRKLLLGSRWTWERAGSPTAEMKFDAQGRMIHDRFITKYTIENTRVVTLRSDADAKVRMQFSEDHTTWEGVDFDGKRPVKGRLVLASPVAAAIR